jgi:hypothetical protein
MRKILLISSFLLFSSCSMMRSAGVKVIAGGIEDSSKELQKETDWYYFKNSVPGNLKLMEMMLSMDSGNEAILTALIQGFVGYGFGVYETLYLEDQIKDNENSKNLKNAISYYTKALHFGYEYLEGLGVKRSKILELIQNESKLQAYLDDNLGESDFKALFYTAQAWGSLINLQRSNMTLMSELPAVKALFDFVCTRKPNFEYGACDLFYASYWMGRPKILGGNPLKGKAIFKSFFKKRQLNLLARIMYLQFAIIAAGDEEEYNTFTAKLELDFEEFSKLNHFGESLKDSNAFNHAPYLKLFNAIAYERYQIIKKLKKEIF